MPLGRLHVITDTRSRRDPLPPTLAALEAGAPVVQVRAKGLSDRKLYELACRVAQAAATFGAMCLVNDRVDLARAVGAAGAHLGDEDLPIAAARRVLGSDGVLGGTARDATTARAHAAAGATYLGVGPAYATSTKTGLPDAIGPKGIAAVADAVTIPVIAIGGVTSDRVRELMDAGAYGVAVVSAIADAEDPHAATEALLRAIDAAP